ncbi:hypothetical protein B0T10DRAFT_456131 [Thelonectria olida]|uniref:C2H2-type domain-containing protein n=1 Tax=Thelonectria olida TaxID=1576542 RepID=A0A9P9AWK1_9HYPO|nr:hypothetical protein B0T10DRAFT_456131 [Thelonectria olida]
MSHLCSSSVLRSQLRPFTRHAPKSDASHSSDSRSLINKESSDQYSRPLNPHSHSANYCKMTVAHPTCGTCLREFPAGYQARARHCEVKGHSIPEFECDTCSDYFGDEWDRRDHMDFEDHWNPNSPQCTVCYDKFPTDEELEEHEIQIHLYCADCMRFFRTRNGIRQHLNSRRHRPTMVVCPFCSQTCGTATGLVHHVERGCCQGTALDRERLHRSIKERDPYGNITFKSLEWYQDITYEATDRSWNPWCNAYECYLCHNLYKNLFDLNQHLASPKHQQALYHCPNRSCSKEFTTLAGLINHLESESCGYMRFQAVQTGVGRLISTDRRIEF